MFARRGTYFQAASLTGTVLYALPAAAVVLALIYYWFGIADRYVAFLYYHDMGPFVQDTSPFSATTSSRYWMAALVACGVVLVLTCAVNWFLGLLIPTLTAPRWQAISLISTPILLLGIPLITMTANNPTLPLRNALQVTVVAVVAMPLALLPGQLALRQPIRLLWLALDGVWQALILTGVAGQENLPRWIATGSLHWVRYSALLAFIVLLSAALVTVLRLRVGSLSESLMATILAGWAIQFLLLPLAHHLFFTDGYLYISNSSNFIANSPVFQLAAFATAAACAALLYRLRHALAQRNHIGPLQPTSEAARASLPSGENE